MKMTTEPSLDAAMFAHKFNEFATFGIVGMIQPTATIDHVIFLQDAQTTTIRWRVCKDKNLPPFQGRSLIYKNSTGKEEEEEEE